MAYANYAIIGGQAAESIKYFPEIKNIAPSIKIPDNKIYLKMRENAGGETKSIELIPDSNGKIASIIFEYGNETNLKYFVHQALKEEEYTVKKLTFDELNEVAENFSNFE